MSADKRNRAERRALDSGAALAVVAEHEALVEAMRNEPTAKLWGLWLVPGQGYSWCEVELPRSIVERYAKSVSVPNTLPVTLAYLDEAIAGYAGKGVAG